LSSDRKLGLAALTAIIVGSMIGGGVFGLPANAAAVAAAGPVLIAWIISGLGIIALAFVYQNLAVRRPDLNAGVYSYAQAGFGNFMGFNSAWGYWLSVLIGNVSYALLLFSALSFLFPVFGSGNNWQSILGASVMVWVINALVLKGVKQAALVNIITTVTKLVPIIVFLIVVLISFKLSTFRLDFWGRANPALGSIMDQVRNTMLITLWVFIGIEGATVVSGRAKKRSDIGKATVIGIAGALVIYLMVSLLSFGIMSRPELAGLKQPSMALVLQSILGPWGQVLISTGLIISLGGAYLAWSLLAAEIPHVAARNGLMPRVFTKENSNGSPVSSLWITNGLIQLFLILTLFAHGTYKSLFLIASTAILLPYFFSGAFAWKLARSGESYAPNENRSRDLRNGVISTIYAAWLLFAAGLDRILTCSVLYALGIVFFVVARKQHNAEKIFTKREKLLAICLVAAAAAAIVLIARGSINPFVD